MTNEPAERKYYEHWPGCGCTANRTAAVMYYTNESRPVTLDMLNEIEQSMFLNEGTKPDMEIVGREEYRERRDAYEATLLYYSEYRRDKRES